MPTRCAGMKNQLPGNDYPPQAWGVSAIPEELYPTSYVATAHRLSGTAPAPAPSRSSCNALFPIPITRSRRRASIGICTIPGQVRLPPSFNPGERRLPPHLQQLYSEREQGKANRDGQRTFAVNEREARQAIALTYGMVTMIDDAIERILQRLDAFGLAGDTIVIFNADHGDFMGDHQLLLKGALHYQGLVRVPFIWSDPAARNHGIANAGPRGTLDLARTILDRAGLQGQLDEQGVVVTRGARQRNRP